MAKFYYEFSSVGLNLAPERAVSLSAAGLYSDGFNLDGSFYPEVEVLSYFDEVAGGWRVSRPGNYWLALPLFEATDEDGDIEIHAVITRGVTGGSNFINSGGGIYLCADATGSSLYSITSGGVNPMYLAGMERTNNINSYPHNITQNVSVLGLVRGSRFHYRVRIAGGLVYVKRWGESVPEPEEWAFTFSNAKGLGGIGLYLNGENVTDRVHSFAVGTQGDPAPTILDAPRQVFWGVAGSFSEGDTLLLADNLSMMPIASLKPASDGAWVADIPGYVPPNHIQHRTAAGVLSIPPGGVNGDGYLAGTYPAGGVTDDSVPAEGAEIEVVLRRPGGEGNGSIVASTVTDASGSWRAAGLSMDMVFDVIARMEGRNDAIVSRVTPERLEELALAGGFSLTSGGTRLSGAIKTIGGTPPFSLSKTSGELPYGMDIRIDDSGSLIVADSTLVEEVGSFTATFEVEDSASHAAEHVIAIADAKRAQAVSLVADEFNGGANATSLTLVIPASVKAGDLLVFGAIHREASAILAPLTSNEAGAEFSHLGSSDAYSAVPGSSGTHWLGIYTLRASELSAGATVTLSGPTSSYKAIHLAGFRANSERLLEVKQHVITATNPQPPPTWYEIPEIETRGGLVVLHTAHPWAQSGFGSRNDWTNARLLLPATGNGTATLRGGFAWYWQEDNDVQAATYSPGASLATPCIAISRLYIDEIRPDLPGW